jgi:hypothetical protein
MSLATGNRSWGDEEYFREVASIIDPIFKAVIRRKMGICLESLWAEHIPLASDGDQSRQFTVGKVRTKDRKTLDAEEAYADSMWALFSKLRAISEGDDQEVIRDLGGYAAKVAENSVHRIMRRNSPKRHWLKGAVLDVLSGRTQAQGFATWQDDGGNRFCGYTKWEGRKPRRTRKLSEWSKSDPEKWRINFISTHLANQDPQEIPLPLLMQRVFDWFGCPLSIGDLVSSVTLLLQIEETATTSPMLGLGSSDTVFDALESLADPTNGSIEDDVLDGIENGKTLRWLWNEIAELPTNQRKALLFALEPEELQAFKLVVPAEQLAALVGLSRRDLNTLISTMPLSDNLIARHIGVTRRQIINMRQAARRRLDRKLRRNGTTDSLAQSRGIEGDGTPLSALRSIPGNGQTDEGSLPAVERTGKVPQGRYDPDRDGRHRRPPKVVLNM